MKYENIEISKIAQNGIVGRCQRLHSNIECKQKKPRKIVLIKLNRKL